ncbi:hypothetical protein PFISCL1PPCAC_18472 [Pristionchus fissidentatus]|uniref:N(4)-(beta-N-acetylglucosaminyl)-L-asparaginase n=1 Tax=Pristionchus fissidentatus TaxID=1538716 RepID=A0AAV5W951_9BILA|nr:hypothetical protein PFISCL1PPCAC_18472 [Pristionchus fissidentatus]
MFSLLLFLSVPSLVSSSIPLVITTWAADGFQQATANAFSSLSGGRMFALVEGLSTCERLQCDTTVGYGGSPDEKGETRLDAILIDGTGMKMGGVAAMRRVKYAARVAWAVLNYTRHTLIVGEAATEFAVEMGFKEESLTTNDSEKATRKWRENNCQPNFRKNVFPDASTSCGPYTPNDKVKEDDDSWTNRIDRFNHDTIGMVIIDSKGEVAAGTSTNGATHKIPGRMGDSASPGSGAYAMEGVGGAAATGDGDIMMRFMPSYHAVHILSLGFSPSEAAAQSIQRILNVYPRFMGAVVVASVKGSYGASCTGLDTFSFSVQSNSTTRVETIKCLP